MRPNVRVFRNRRVAKAWLQERAGTFLPNRTVGEMAVDLAAEVNG